MSLFKPNYIDQRIDLSPTEFREASQDINGYLLEKMRARMEGKCTTHGFVKNGSMQILARSMGQAEHGRFTGSFLYYCKLRIDCFLPHAEQIVDGRILKMNKLGAYALLSENGEDLEAMRILLPRDLHLGNASFDSLTVGSMVRMRLLRSRFQANDAFIQAVALYESTLVTGAVRNMIDTVGLSAVPEGDEDATNVSLSTSKKAEGADGGEGEDGGADGGEGGDGEGEVAEDDKITLPPLLPAVTATGK